MIPQHSSETNEAYTPNLIVVPSRKVLLTIDWDPASCAIANELVQATRYGSADNNGWHGEWCGNTFLNPPGGLFSVATGKQVATADKKGHQRQDLVSSAAAWWSRLVWEYTFGVVDAAIFICFSMAILRNAQSPKLKAVGHPLDFPICLPKDRINYDKLEYRYEGVASEPTAVDDPALGSWHRTPTKGAPADTAIVYLPDKADPEAGKARFVEAFQHLGKVRL